MVDKVEKLIDDLTNFEKSRRIHLTGDLEDDIFSILTWNRLRIGTLDKSIEAMLRKKISESVTNDLPITLVPAFGGFKAVHLPTAPGIDYAESFQLSFLLKSIFQISEIYSPGLLIEFTGDSEILTLVNNLPLNSVQIYTNEFKKLLDWYSNFLPKNIRLSYTSLADFYDLESLFREVKTRAENSEFQVTRLEHAISKAKKHYLFDQSLSVEEMERSALQSAKLAIAWLDYDIENRGDYLEGGERIPVLHRKGIPGCYSIKSIKSTSIQFWVGTGGIIFNEDTHTKTLITKKIYDDLGSRIRTIEVQNDLDISGLKSIPIIAKGN